MSKNWGLIRKVFLFSFLSLIDINLFAQRYKNPTGTEFPILAWHALDSDHNNYEDYCLLSDAGFNLSLSFFSSIKEVLAGLKACEGTGVKLVTSCWEQKFQTRDFILRVKDSPNLAFYFTDDEPTKADFSELKKKISERNFYDGKHLCYVNLMPNYATTDQLNAASYEDYIESYIKLIRPSMISFDFYPFRYSGFRDGYYDNLIFISSICKKNRIPFWGFIMSSTNDEYPVINEAYLRFQAAINLAFGAKGLQYFTYSLPAKSFKTAILNEDFSKTDIYDIIKGINLDILKYSNVWLNSNVIYVWFVGENPPAPLDKNYKLRCLKQIKADGPGFVTSYIKSRGKEYLIAINSDVNNSQVLIIDSKKIVTLCKRNCERRFKKESLLVAPGDFVLIRL